MEVLDQEERRMVLVAIDNQWQAHLYNMDALREGVDLRAQGQKDPLIEYKNEAYNLFVTLMDSIKQEALQNLFRSAANLEAIPQAAPQRATAASRRRGRAHPGQRRHLRQLRQPRSIRPSLARRNDPETQPSQAEAEFLNRDHRPQRDLSLRLRQEIQAMLRSRGLRH